MPLEDGCGRLAAQPEPADDGPITSWILAHQVGKESTTLSDELEQTPARMIVLRKGAEMLGQALDSLCQQSDLDLRRSCVILRSGVVRHDAFLGFPRQGHPFLQRSFFSQFRTESNRGRLSGLSRPLFGAVR